MQRINVTVVNKRKKASANGNFFRGGCPLFSGKQNALCYFYSIAGRTGLWKYGFDLYKLQNNFHCSVALSLANLDDTCIAALAVSILGSDFIKNLSRHINLLGTFLTSGCSCRNFGNRVQNFRICLLA